MRRFALILAALVLLIVGHTAISVAAQSPPERGGTVSAPCPKQVTAAQFAKFSERVWNPDHWQRGAPKKITIRAQRLKIRCAAGPGHRKVMQRKWRRDRRSYNYQRAKLQREFINYTWDGAVYPSSAWFSLPELKPYVAAALAEAAGDYAGTNTPGWTMVQLSHGEGHLKPGSRSTDNGWGWLAITSPYGDGYGVHALGGYDEMLNPVKNAYIAALMLANQGFGAWYGDGHVTHWNLHYTGKFDIRDALGGLTFGQALRR